MKLEFRHKNIALLLIIAGLVTAVCLLLVANVLRKSTQNDNGSQIKKSIQAPDLKSAEVQIGENGFTPQTITMQKGGQLVWTNKGTAPHKIAGGLAGSRDKSQTQLMSEELAPNDSYTFIFNESGTYHYDDALNPNKMQGTVIVK